MKHFFYFSILIYCVSCTTPKKESSDYPILHHINVNLNEEYVGKGGALIAYNDGVIGIEESNMLPSFFFLSTKEKAHTYTHFGHRGQGPNDFIHPYPIQYINENVFGVYDMMLRNYKEVTIPQNDTSIQISSPIMLETNLFSAIKTAYGQYAGLSTKEGLFVLMDSTGKKIDVFFEYPYQNNDERAIKNHLRSMAYQGTLAVNPKRTKCVYAPLNGEIIHFYTMQKNEISLIKKIEAIYPRYKPEENGMSYAAMLDANNIVGYISLAATDKFIYALYCGQTNNDLKKKGHLVFAGKQLRIFDWTGMMIKTFILDVTCSYISVTNDDSRLWAMAFLPEITPVYFDLNEMNKEDSHLEKSQHSHITTSSQPFNLETKKSENAIMTHDDSLKINQLNIGKIKIGETQKYTLQLPARITSYQATSDNLVLQDSLMPSNESSITISLTKQFIGRFNDTIYMYLNDHKSTLLVSGEVVK